MAGIIKGSINLSEIPKDKIIEGKKGKYLPISITINDEVDQFGNFGPIIVDQSKGKEMLRLLRNILVMLELFGATVLSLMHRSKEHQLQL